MGDALISLGRGFLLQERGRLGREGESEEEKGLRFSSMSFRRNANLYMQMNLEMQLKIHTY